MPREAEPDGFFGQIAATLVGTDHVVARESYGRLVAYLSVHTHDLASAEDALSEALTGPALAHSSAASTEGSSWNVVDTAASVELSLRNWRIGSLSNTT